MKTLSPICIIILFFFSCENKEAEKPITIAPPKKIQAKGTMHFLLFRERENNPTVKELEKIFTLPEVSNVVFDSSYRHVRSARISTYKYKFEKYDLCDSTITATLKNKFHKENSPVQTFSYKKNGNRNSSSYRYTINDYSSTPFKKDTSYSRMGSKSTLRNSFSDLRYLPVKITPNNDTVYLKDIAYIYENYRFRRREIRDEFSYIVSMSFNSTDLNKDVKTLKERLKSLKTSYFITLSDTDGNPIQRF